MDKELTLDHYTSLLSIFGEAVNILTRGLKNDEVPLKAASKLHSLYNNYILGHIARANQLDNGDERYQQARQGVIYSLANLDDLIKSVVGKDILGNVGLN